jgi:hypothetical protein
MIMSAEFNATIGFSHLKLEFGAYLGFGICDLGF